jgi:putative Mg2+ transporter-C (MgtC) family protein
LPDLSTAEALLRLLVAAGLGGAIGLERELRDHEAGFRTHLLVSLGACAFTLVSAYAWTDWTFSQKSGVVFDPTRIAAQIVTGIGFLGAGAIIVRGVSVRGLTTAATLWVVAAIGMASGTGYYPVAVGAAVLVLVSLGPLKLISTRLVARVRPEQAALAIVLAPGADPALVLDRIEHLGGHVSHVEFGDDRTIDVTLWPSRRSESARVAARVNELEEVERVQWRP